MVTTASTVTILKALQIRLDLSRNKVKKSTELIHLIFKSIFRSHYFIDALIIAIGLDVKHKCLLDC